MANKKISELSSRTPSLTDLMLVGDPSSGYSYKCTITALATIIETDIADGYVTLSTTQTISGAKTFSNVLTLTSVANAATTQTKFLTLNGSNVVNYRTGAEVLSDIGGADDSLVVHKAGTETITGVKTFNAGLSLPNYVAINFSNSARVEGYDGKVLFRTVYGAAGWFQDNSLYLAQMDNITDTSSIGVLVKNYSGEAKVGYKTPAQMLTYLGAQGSLTLTTTGTSGAATLVGNTLNIPQYQEVLTNPVTGTGTTNYIPKFTGSSAIGNSEIFTDSGSNLYFKTASTSIIGFQNNSGTQIQRIFYDDSDGSLNVGGSTALGYPIKFYTGTSERMRLDASGNLGLGTSSPSYKLDVVGTSRISTSSGENLILEKTAGAYLSFYNGSTLRASINGFNAVDGLSFNTGASHTTRMTLDASGNLGLGVTPSAWSASYKAIQISSFAAIAQGGNDTYIGNNWYNDGSNKYLQPSGASLYGQSNGSHFWFNAPSGTAGNAISFTQAMTLTSSQNLLIGTTTDAGYRLDVNASLAIAKFNGTASSGGYIVFQKQSTDQAYLGASAAISGVGTNFDIWATGGNGISLYSNGSPSNNLTLTSGGQVGIGNTIAATMDANNGSGTLVVGTGSGSQGMTIYSGSATNNEARLTFANASTGAGSYAAQISYKTTDNALLFFNQNAERMRITSGGDVVIAGTTATNTAAGRGNITIGGTSNSILNFSINGANSGYIFHSGSLEIMNSTSNPITFGTALNERMRITSGGNVGIGTSSPSGNFDIFSSSNVYQNISTNGTNQSAVLSLYNSTATGDGAALGYNVAMRFGTITGLNAAGFTERMRITSGGELLINTTSDAGDYKLQVNGNVYAGNLDLYKSSGNVQFALISGSDSYTTRFNDSDNTYRIYSSIAADDIYTLTSGGNIILGGSIKTAAPSGFSAQPWKLGDVTVTSITVDTDKYISVDINGTVYNIPTCHPN